MFYVYETQIIDSIKDVIKKYKNNLHLVVIYGSYAIRRHKPDSDLDLLIVGKENIKKEILNDLSEIYIKYSIIVSTSFYTPKQYKIIEHDPFIQRALNEGLILWERRMI